MDTKKTSTPPSQLRWMKDRYNSDEQYRQKQINNAKSKYQLKKEELKERYQNDAEYRAKIHQRNKINNEKIRQKRLLDAKQNQ